MLDKSIEAPPEYQPSDDATLRLFNRVQSSLDGNGGRTSELDPEAERMRNFLLFCLAVDYRFTGDFALSASDCKHFLAMNNLLCDMQRAHARTHLTARERNTLAPYYWKYLHAPCQSISIPVEAAAGAVANFAKYRSIYDRYKGCAHGVLHTFGALYLARKIWIDKQILLPRLVTSSPLRGEFIGRVNELSRLYFTSIDGSASVILPTESGDHDGPFWSAENTIRCELTERGQQHHNERKACIDLTKRSSILSPGFLLERALSCIPGLKARRDASSKGQVHTWKGPSPPPADTPMTSHLWQIPAWWNSYYSMHLPDLFEYRNGSRVCDT